MKQRFSNLGQWLSWLETLHPKEIDLGLTRVYEVAKSLGLYAKYDDLRCSGVAHNSNGTLPTVITVAGTNGKGSFVKTQQHLLMHANRSVGCFTSPHILNYNERITLDGAQITDASLCELFEFIDQARLNISLTYFEFTALAAMLAFNRANCSFWVLEVGLGGRLDASNIIDNSLSVITSIGYDHQQWLGETLDEIATEKAGIIRNGKPVVLASQNMPNILTEKAVNKKCNVITNGIDYYIEHDENHDDYSLQYGDGFSVKLGHLSLPVESVVAALITMLELNLIVLTDVSPEMFENLKLAGRFEQAKLGKKTLVYDVAHNPMATARLADNLISFKAKHQVDRVECLVGMMADKEISESLKPLLVTVDHWHCCTLAHCERSAKSEYLMEKLKAIGADSQFVTCYDNVENALNQWVSSSTEVNDEKVLILIVGSFFTVSDAKRYILNVGEN